MEKIFEIASSITNPISLVALFFIILYLLYKGIIAKIGLQKGEKGYQLLKQLMNTVAILAIITLILVFVFKAYRVYSKVDEIPVLTDINNKLDLNQNQLEKSTNTVVNETFEIKAQIEQSKDSLKEKIDRSTVTIIKETKKAQLNTQFHLGEYTGGNLLIGNNGGEIILMKNLKIFWNYSECSQIEIAEDGSPIVTFRYKVNVTKENGSKLIDNKEFKYGAGDIDKFLVKIYYPALGIYEVWFSFEYKIFGSNQWLVYKTVKDKIEKCSE
jgi:nitrogen fixation/metabolism regulation signal transduction histidine kinase